MTRFASLAACGVEAGPRVEFALKQHLPLAHMPGNVIFDCALQDAVFPGGRRFRPMLALLASELVRADDDDALAAAVAAEYLHCAALIFDDLPAMDDARERRGRPCLHLRCGEGVAITVALALMNASYQVAHIVASRASRDRALRELTECIAAQIAGQAADLAGDGSSRRWESSGKTSALIRLALTLGPLLSGADAGDVAALSRFGQTLGEAYQLVDDSRDVEEDRRLPRRGRRATFAMERGCEAARERAERLTAEARRDLLARFGDLPSAHRLCEFANLSDVHG
jgi:geranylgeranyl diphosphate synthase type II